MTDLADIAIVLVSLAGSALYLLRRFFKKTAASAACASGCGACGDEPAYRATPLVGLGRK